MNTLFYACIDDLNKILNLVVQVYQCILYFRYSANDCLFVNYLKDIVFQIIYILAVMYLSSLPKLRAVISCQF